MGAKMLRGIVGLRRARAILAVGAALAVAVGCGSEDGPETTTVRNQNVVVALGDSITSGAPNYEANPATRLATGWGHDERSQWEYWAERRYPKFDLRNCGVQAERTDEIAARLQACVDRAQAGGIVIQGGVNDISQGVSVETVGDNLRGMVGEAKAMGLRVAIADLLPWNSNYVAADPLIRELNRLIAQIAQEEEIPLLPFHDTLADPNMPALMPAKLTADGIHPSIAGYRRLGELAFRPPR